MNSSIQKQDKCVYYETVSLYSGFIWLCNPFVGCVWLILLIMH